MQNVKTAIKKALSLDYNSFVEPLKNLKYIGSHHHGYYIPAKFLNDSSICYCIGAGVDVSFDTELIVNYNSKVYIFDPAPDAKEHFNKVKNAATNGEKFAVGKKVPFTYRLTGQQLENVQFIEKGLWNESTVLKFYKATDSNYPSHSIDLFNGSSEFIEAPVERLSSIMKKLNHTYIDLLKIEIEGAEYVVINTIIEDKPDIKVILVEFDELFHPKDYKYLFRIKKATESLLKAGYKLAHSTPHFKRLFVREDVFEDLKKK